MFAYPKRTWATILEELSSSGPQVPSDELRGELDRYSEENLSSTAMAAYLLDVLDYKGAQSHLSMTSLSRGQIIKVFSP